ncbi:siroheme synthase [Vibrio sp. ZSDZ34]|jgi:precorrin-2 dehydrogenase/sirohydrochlorin ferrochelatase|uniref:precorrin-2 dehydrogenase n=1 Tax=Vibrio gelatinilyticus TaxID=2893468 RepID=A0A9X1WHF8_9VIBR|nr:siroheme synthase [Vibrio gelatinilyticus]MCJ2376634.1 siroheme synthase [Vibrio gelatinilyticus]
MRYFPLFMDLLNKAVLVVGGGEVACRKVESLVRAGASVTVVSPQVEPYIADLVQQGKCEWLQNFYSSECLTSKYVQVWATTNNPDLNHQVHNDAKNMGIMVNVVDDTPFCDFITPSMINRGRIQIAISSGGASPVLIRGIREKVESLLPMNLAIMADFASSKRNDIKNTYKTVDDRRKFWELFFRLPTVVDSKNNHELEKAYQKLKENKHEFVHGCTWVEFGDDVELLSLKALRLMQEAERVFYHKDCPFEFIDLVRRDAERELFKDIADVSDTITTLKQEGARVVVLIPQHFGEHRLVGACDTAVCLASEK